MCLRNNPVALVLSAVQRNKSCLLGTCVEVGQTPADKYSGLVASVAAFDGCHVAGRDGQDGGIDGSAALRIVFEFGTISTNTIFLPHLSRKSAT